MRPQTSALIAASAAAAAWMLYKKKKKRRVVITGCCGNLGRKLGAYLQERGVEVVGIEHPDYCAKGSPPPCHAVVQGDAQRASDASDRPWRAVLRGADAVVHFSAVNPYPNADWAESSGSMDHAFNVALAAADAGVPRFILASSNHVSCRVLLFASTRLRLLDGVNASPARRSWAATRTTGATVW